MSRDSHGQFAAGCSGNSNGRPPKRKRTFTNEQVREDLLCELEENIELTLDGKTRKLPKIRVIIKKLVLKALQGDTRSILKVLEMRSETVSEMVNERLALLEAYLENVKLYKQNPDDVTDEMIEHLRFIREELKRDNLLH
jgi:replication-associated recombination protein RarA